MRNENGIEHAVMSTILHLYIAVEADRRHKHTLHVLEGHRAMLFLVDEKREIVFNQIQQNTNSRPLAYSPLSPGEKQILRNNL